MKRLLATGMLSVAVVSVVAGCGRPAPSTLASPDPLMAEGKEFKEKSESALKQILGQSTSGVIPAAKLLEISRVADARMMRLASARSGALPPLRSMFVLEASQLVELSDVRETGSSPMKGLVVLAAPVAERTFDWTAVAIVDMKAWEVVDIGFNPSFGKRPRTYQPDGGKDFPIMNDYVGALYQAQTAPSYATPYRLKRVFVPEEAGEQPSVERLDRLYVYIPSKEKDKRFMLDAHRSLYQLGPARPGVQGLSKSALQKVGELR